MYSNNLQFGGKNYVFFLTMGWNGVYFQTPNRPLYRNLGEQTALPAEN